MPTPAQLEIALNAELMIDYDCFAPITPGRPPSPWELDDASEKESSTPSMSETDTVIGDKEDTFMPAPPPPRESVSVPASFPRRNFRLASARPANSLPTSLDGSCDSSRNGSLTASALPSRNGSPAWRRPTSAWGRMNSGRAEQPKLYTGREAYGAKEERMTTYLGQYGHLHYDVRVSKTGSPRGRTRCTPSFNLTAPHSAREKAYEGKEHMKAGQYGPGMYDIRCFKTGSPTGKAKGTPRFGSGARFDREKCYEGRWRDNNFGKEGASGLNPPMCSNRGSPLWKGYRPSAAFAQPHVPRVRPHERVA